MANTQQLTERFEDRREIKNLMGKYVSSLLLKRESTLLDAFWSKRGDICLGFNGGYYKGRSAIAGYYDAVTKATALKGKLLQKKFPEQLGKLTDEALYGVGPYEAKPLTSFYMQEADDGQTAKALWMVQGIDTDVTVSGPVTYWTWGYYAGDFIQEDGTWKLWHLRYEEDVHHLAGQDWGKDEVPYPTLPEFAALAECKLPPFTVAAEVRAAYGADRPLTPCPQIPAPYRTFTETFSYGV